MEMFDQKDQLILPAPGVEAVWQGRKKVYMKKLIVEHETLVKAVKKASASLKDTFVLKIISVEVGKGQLQGSLSCCNDSTQAVIYIPVKADNDACGEYIFGKEFGTIVQTLSVYDDKDFIIKCNSDGMCTIACGNADVPIPVCNSTASIPLQDIAANGALVVECKAESFREAAVRGGCAYSGNIGGAYEIVRNVINLVLEKTEKQYNLQFITSDGMSASIARAQIVKQSGLDNLKDGEASFCVNATVFLKIASAISSESVTLYLAKTQILLRDGNDVYIIVPNANTFPVSIGIMLRAELPTGYRFKVAKKRLLAAMDVASLGNDQETKYKVCAMVEDGKLTISSVDGACSSRPEIAEISGAVKIAFNSTRLRSLFGHGGEDILICGAGAEAPIYISDGVDGARCLLSPATLESEKVSEKSGSKNGSSKK